ASDEASDMSDPGGPRFTGVIVARVGSSVEYVGNTPGHPASRDDFGRNPFAGGACLCSDAEGVGGVMTISGQMRRLRRR
ncbi:hypothetical protein ACTMTF_18650, partial [Nonomuraea sp. ZG12]|uniref:hypothetical protein n=1 Tax=Nonomuraea sp. ZG12 TaxID=3452207 RepID=UPI003F8A8EE6